jgi:phage terminase small subunit
MATEEGKEVKRVTSKEMRFINEYLKDSNGTQAAIRAGYSKRSAGQIAGRLMKKDKIRAYLDEKQGKVEAKCEITAEYILNSLKNIAEKCQQATPVLDHEGEPTGEYEFDSAGANRSLELLGKWRKLWTDRMEIEGTVNLADAVREARTRIKQ